jgi:hypothetical protein
MRQSLHLLLGLLWKKELSQVEDLLRVMYLVDWWIWDWVY